MFPAPWPIQPFAVASSFMTDPKSLRDALVREHVRSARSHLAWAEHGAATPTLPGPEKIGFHAQQAVEKLLKGLLISYDVEPEPTS
jgi:hypothetical protein